MIKRNTLQKSLVFTSVIKLKHHPTADEVYNDIVQTHPTISKGTIYRNLNQLAENMEIKKIEVPDGADRFDYRLENHYHTQCSICNQVFDVDMEYIKDLPAAIKDSNGFEFSGHYIMFCGICASCKK